MKKKNSNPVGALKRTGAYMSSSMGIIIFALVLAALSAVMTIIGPDKIGKMATIMSDGLLGGIDLAAIARVGILLAVIYGLSALFGFIQHYIMASVTLKMSYRMRAELSEKINRVPQKYFNFHAQGDILSRITNDVSTLQQGLTNSLPTIISAATQFAGCLIMMFVTEWRLALAALGITLVGLLLVVLIMSRSQKYFTARQESLGKLNGYVEEMYSGHEVVRISRAAEPVGKTFDTLNDAVYDANWRSQFLSGLMMPLMSLVGNMGYVGVVVVGAQLALTGNATPGDIQSFIQYVRNFTQPVQQLGNVSNTMQSMAAATERVFEFLAAPEEEQKADAQIPEKRPGHVEFDHVKFGYTPDKTIIHDFSCEAQPGQTIAIVGPTGAGKTTLIKLLQRFYDVDGGSLRVEGVDVRDWDRAALRGEFAMVLQDTWLFNGTIRENIRYGRPDASDAEVEAAARAARCDHFIHTLAGGYDFMINEEGTNLSQGQRQLVTIARAILADRPALILDEATSNVDTRTEELIQRAMDALMQGRTSFVIAHRLSTIRNADVILVIRDGDIVEKGTHDELLAQGGFYADLYNSQFDEAA